MNGLLSHHFTLLICHCCLLDEKNVCVAECVVRLGVVVNVF